MTKWIWRMYYFGEDILCIMLGVYFVVAAIWVMGIRWLNRPENRPVPPCH